MAKIIFETARTSQENLAPKVKIKDLGQVTELQGLPSILKRLGQILLRLKQRDLPNDETLPHNASFAYGILGAEKFIALSSSLKPSPQKSGMANAPAKSPPKTSPAWAPQIPFSPFHGPKTEKHELQQILHDLEKKSPFAAKIAETLVQEILNAKEMRRSLLNTLNPDLPSFHEISRSFSPSGSSKIEHLSRSFEQANSLLTQANPSAVEANSPSRPVVEIPIPKTGHSPDLSKQLEHLLQKAVLEYRQDGSTHFQAHLHPKDYGTIRLTLSLHEGQLHVRMGVANELVRQEILSLWESLQPELLQNGIEIGSLSVFVSTHSWNTRQSGESYMPASFGFVPVFSETEAPEEREGVYA